MKKRDLHSGKVRYGKLMAGAIALAGIVGAPMALAIGQGVASATTGVYSTSGFTYCSLISSSNCLWLPVNATGILSTTVQPASSVVCNTYAGWYDNGSSWMEGAESPVFTCNGNPPVAIIENVVAGTPIQVGTSTADPGFNLSY